MFPAPFVPLVLISAFWSLVAHRIYLSCLPIIILRQALNDMISVIDVGATTLKKEREKKKRKKKEEVFVLLRAIFGIPRIESRVEI